MEEKTPVHMVTEGEGKKAFKKEKNMKRFI